LYDPSF